MLTTGLIIGLLTAFIGVIGLRQARTPNGAHYAGTIAAVGVVVVAICATVLLVALRS